MAAALTLLEIGDIRDIYLFDTFAGMTEPTDVDVDYVGNSARPRFARSITGDHSEWCYASLEDVRQNVLSTGYPEERCHFIKGDVRQTIPFDGLGDIALLRLDTDWYELNSARAEASLSEASKIRNSDHRRLWALARVQEGGRRVFWQLGTFPLCGRPDRDGCSWFESRNARLRKTASARDFHRRLGTVNLFGERMMRHPMS